LTKFEIEEVEWSLGKKGRYLTKRGLKFQRKRKRKKKKEANKNDPRRIGPRGKQIKINILQLKLDSNTRSRRYQQVSLALSLATLICLVTSLLKHFDKCAMQFAYTTEVAYLPFFYIMNT
jgi:hypothetical protein